MRAIDAPTVTVRSGWRPALTCRARVGHVNRSRYDIKPALCSPCPSCSPYSSWSPCSSWAPQPLRHLYPVLTAPLVLNLFDTFTPCSPRPSCSRSSPLRSTSSAGSASSSCSQRSLCPSSPSSPHAEHLTSAMQVLRTHVVECTGGILGWFQRHDFPTESPTRGRGLCREQFSVESTGLWSRLNPYNCSARST